MMNKDAIYSLCINDIHHKTIIFAETNEIYISFQSKGLSGSPTFIPYCANGGACAFTEIINSHYTESH